MSSSKTVQQKRRQRYLDAAKSYREHKPEQLSKTASMLRVYLRSGEGKALRWMLKTSDIGIVLGQRQVLGQSLNIYITGDGLRADNRGNADIDPRLAARAFLESRTRPINIITFIREIADRIAARAPSHQTAFDRSLSFLTRMLGSWLMYVEKTEKGRAFRYLTD